MSILQKIKDNFTLPGHRNCIECNLKIQKKEKTKYVQIKRLEVAYHFDAYEPDKFSPKVVDKTIYVCQKCWDSNAPKNYRFQND